MHVTTILFDFDGTLVDYLNSDRDSLKVVHSLADSTVSFDDFMNMSVDEITKFHNLVDQSKIDPLLMHEFRLKNTFKKLKMVWEKKYVYHYKRSLISMCSPYAGIEDVLLNLKKKVKLGLLTNAYDPVEQRERLKSSGLEPYFDEVVVAGDIGVYKPDPSLFLYILNRMNVVPDKSLYVGDSVIHDIIGAKEAGMKTALFSINANRESSLADYVIHGIDELQDFIEAEV